MQELHGTATLARYCFYWVTLPYPQPTGVSGKQAPQKNRGNLSLVATVSPVSDYSGIFRRWALLQHPPPLPYGADCPSPVLAGTAVLTFPPPPELLTGLKGSVGH